jgi:hypothetical protein
MFFFVKKIKTEGKKKYIYIRKDVQQIAWDTVQLLSVLC